MKNYLLCLLSMSVVAVSCDPGPMEPEVMDDVNTAEAAEVVGAAMAEEDQGLTATLTDVATLSANASESNDGGRALSLCGVQQDTTLSRMGDRGRFSFDYTFNFTTELICNAQQFPDSFDASVSYEGSFEGNRYGSESMGSGTLSLTNFLPNQDNYAISGGYMREGEFSTLAMGDTTFTSQVTFTLAEVLLDKETYEVVSGSGSVEVSGTVTPGGNTFDYTASLTYLGGGQAEVVIEGTTYLIDLTSGEITPQ